MGSRRWLFALSIGAVFVASGGMISRAGDVDSTPPVTTAVLSPPLSESGWANEAVEVTLFAEDNDGGSGVQSVSYSATGAQEIEPAVVEDDQANVVIDRDGVTTISYFATDNAGNAEEQKEVLVRVDRTPPTLSANADPRKLRPPNKRKVTVTVSGQVSDQNSGFDATTGTFAVKDEYGQLDSNGELSIAENGTYSFTVQLKASRRGGDRNGRTYTIEVTAGDIAGNTSTATTTVVVPHDRRRRR